MSDDIDADVQRHPELVHYSCYATQVDSWRRAFGPEAVKVIRFESFVADRQANADAIFAFLGVRPWTLPAPDEVHNAASDNVVAVGLWQRLSESPLYRQTLRRILSERARRRLLGLVLPKARPRPAGPVVRDRGGTGGAAAARGAAARRDHRRGALVGPRRGARFAATDLVAPGRLRSADRPCAALRLEPDRTPPTRFAVRAAQPLKGFGVWLALIVTALDGGTATGSPSAGVRRHHPAHSVRGHPGVTTPAQPQQSREASLRFEAYVLVDRVHHTRHRAVVADPCARPAPTRANRDEGRLRRDSEGAGAGARYGGDCSE